MLVRCSSPVRGGKAKEKKEDKKGGKPWGYRHTYTFTLTLEASSTQARTRARTSNMGRGVFLSPPEPAEIYSQVPQDKW